MSGLSSDHEALAVEVNTNDSDKGRDKSSSLSWSTFFKWIVMIVLFFSVLMSLVVSKLTLLSIALKLKPPGGNHTDIKGFASAETISTSSMVPEPFIGVQPTANNRLQTDKQISKTYESDVAYTMLILFMLIPHVFNFVRSFITSACSSTQLWPSRKAILVGVIGAVCEVSGLCLFTLIVIPKLRNVMRTIFLMNGVFVVPLLYITVDQIRQFYRNFYPRPKDNQDDGTPLNSLLDPQSVDRQQSETSIFTIKTKSLKCQLVIAFLYTFSAMMSLAGLLALLSKVESLMELVGIPLSVVLCSVAWLPQLQEFQIKPEAKSSTIGASSSSKPISLRASLQNARYRMTLISSSVKIILTFGFAYGLNEMNLTDTENRDHPLINGFKHFLDDKHFVWTFILHILGAFIGKLGSWLACKINLQRSCFVIPFLLSTPISITLVSPIMSGAYGTCSLLLDGCPNEGGPETWHTILLGVLFYASGLSFSIQIFTSQQFIMAKEEILFWLPGYNSIFLEQHVILNKKNEITDTDFVNYKDLVKKSHVYICTTMYHEADFEMEQLIQSLAEIDRERKNSSDHHMEAHIFFDDAVRGTTIMNYALQLLSLFKSTINIEASDTTKTETPYGLQLKYTLQNGMPLVLHLKDKLKVKSKKRWSQVMYMSYMLDFKRKKRNDDLSYMLVTDADVKFTHHDVMALMDSISRDPSIAAVCGRTHPMGSCPVVWYQMFDYAVSHWLGKVSNHVLGTVLCSPGCFSLYRATAVRDVLSTYASSVDSPMDFLKKDMGEDRWFCTLLVEKGWKLEFCAIASNSTYCPDTFDEFFKQRRRWGPSTFANLVELLHKHRTIRQNNNNINIFFIAFQLIQMMSSMINPSTILLLMAAGLHFAYPHIDMIGVLVLLVSMTVGFALVCIYCRQDTQFQVAKVLSFIFAIVMCITTVGCVVQIVNLKSSKILPTFRPASPSYNISTNVWTSENNTTIGITTWYTLTMISMYVVTGILHGAEVLILLYGILYWLALPSGHLLLTIYSIANLTDRSWGTRETKESGTFGVQSTLMDRFTVYFQYFCWCCVPPQYRNSALSKDEDSDSDQDVEERDKERYFFAENEESDENIYMDPDEVTSTMKNYPSKIRTEIPRGPSRPMYGNIAQGMGERRFVAPVQPSAYLSAPKLQPRPHENHRTFSTLSGLKKQKGWPQPKTVSLLKKQTLIQKRWSNIFANAMAVEDWLTSLQYQEYISTFQEHGFDNVSFITGSISEKDLVDMGITNQGHRKKLLAYIEYLPPPEQTQDVPEDVKDWLINLGLEKYWSDFKKAAVEDVKDLAQLKTMTDEELSIRFNITKRGHLKKLSGAVKYLQYATKSQKLIRQTREKMSLMRTRNLNENLKEEAEFWEKLRKHCLLPEQDAFNHSEELGEKLADMRKYCLLTLLVANALWLTFMGAIMQQGPKLHVMGESFIGVAFTFLFGLILVLQFISLIIHRIETLIHYIARTPGTLTSNNEIKGDQPNGDTASHRIEECIA